MSLYFGRMERERGNHYGTAIPSFFHIRRDGIIRVRRGGGGRWHGSISHMCDPSYLHRAHLLPLSYSFIQFIQQMATKSLSMLSRVAFN